MLAVSAVRVSSQNGWGRGRCPGLIPELGWTGSEGAKNNKERQKRIAPGLSDEQEKL
jgi:hypothetical protein